MSLTKQECEQALDNVAYTDYGCCDSETYDKSVKILNELIDQHFDEKGHIIAKVCFDEEKLNEIVKEALRNLTWIPVEERLPELAGYACLVTIQNKFGQRKIAKVFTHYGTGTFWLCNERDINLNAWEVIAWMPLPEPYKKVEE